jgi:ABC-2 type transport system permease protein
MKQSGFKNSIKERWEVLKIILRNSYQLDTAYFSQTFGDLLSTIGYCVTFLLFLQILFSNVPSIAGYDKNEMIFFTFIGQIVFYTMWATTFINNDNLIIDVNKGNLDLILTKPLPHLFYLSLRELKLIGMIRDGLPPLIMYALVIDWGKLGLEPFTLIIGIIVLLLGELAFHVFQFLLLLPVFWIGESSEFYGLIWSFYDINVPLEGVPKVLKTAFITVIPILTTTAVSVSVILGRSKPIPTLILISIVAAFFIVIKNAAWKFALRHYSSASS